MHQFLCSALCCIARHHRAGPGPCSDTPALFTHNRVNAAAARQSGPSRPLPSGARAAAAPPPAGRGRGGRRGARRRGCALRAAVKQRRVSRCAGQGAAGAAPQQSGARPAQRPQRDRTGSSGCTGTARTLRPPEPRRAAPRGHCGAHRGRFYPSALRRAPAAPAPSSAASLS